MYRTSLVCEIIEVPFCGHSAVSYVSCIPSWCKFVYATVTCSLTSQGICLSIWKNVSALPSLPWSCQRGAAPFGTRARDPHWNHCQHRPACLTPLFFGFAFIFLWTLIEINCFFFFLNKQFNKSFFFFSLNEYGSFFLNKYKTHAVLFWLLARINDSVLLNINVFKYQSDYHGFFRLWHQIRAVYVYWNNFIRECRETQASDIDKMQARLMPNSVPWWPRLLVSHLWCQPHKVMSWAQLQLVLSLSTYLDFRIQEREKGNIMVWIFAICTQ